MSWSSSSPCPIHWTYHKPSYLSKPYTVMTSVSIKVTVLNANRLQCVTQLRTLFWRSVWFYMLVWRITLIVLLNTWNTGIYASSQLVRKLYYSHKCEIHFIYHKRKITMQILCYLSYNFIFWVQRGFSSVLLQCGIRSFTLHLKLVRSIDFMAALLANQCRKAISFI